MAVTTQAGEATSPRRRHPHASPGGAVPPALGATGGSMPGRLPALALFHQLTAVGLQLAQLRGHTMTDDPLVDEPDRGAATSLTPTSAFACSSCGRFLVVTLQSDEHVIGGSASMTRCGPRPSTPVEDQPGVLVSNWPSDLPGPKYDNGGPRMVRRNREPTPETSKW